MSLKKDAILNKLSIEIANLQAAYAAFKNLPDKVFETLDSTLNGNDLVNGNTLSSTIFPSNQSPNSASEDNAFDGKKGIVYDIIKRYGVAIRKKDIVRMYFESNPKARLPESSVTFALSALRSANKIKNFNPSANGNVKAGFWTLTEWWDGDKLIDKYYPIGFFSKQGIQ